jgi:hypothetical protein
MPTIFLHTIANNALQQKSCSIISVDGLVQSGTESASLFYRYINCSFVLNQRVCCISTSSVILNTAEKWFKTSKTPLLTMNLSWPYLRLAYS